MSEEARCWSLICCEGVVGLSSWRNSSGIAEDVSGEYCSVSFAEAGLYG